METEKKAPEVAENNVTKFSDVAAIGGAFNKFKSRHKERRRTKFSNFERRYSKLASNQGLIPERKRIDYVLVYPNIKSEDTKDSGKRAELKRHERNRERFTQLMKQDGFSIQFDTVGEFVYVKLHCPFKRMCVEAEKVQLEMPLKDCEIPETKIRNPILKKIDDHFDTENDVSDFVSATFLMDKIHLFEGYEDPTHFFRPAVRSLLVHHMLINLDIRTIEEIREDDEASDDENEDHSCSCCPSCCRNFFCSNKSAPHMVGGVGTRQALKRKGLKYLLMKKSYVDSFLLHEDSAKSRENEDTGKDFYLGNDAPIVPIEEDPRRELDERWSKVFKFQPLWHIRNYFGEKIAFYFAWTGMLITTLWIPMVFGVIIFFYGLSESINDNSSYNGTSVSEKLQDVLLDVKKAFDNDVTPFFALFICCWGTVFLEMWKRESATLSYEWDVDQFEDNEPDRPQFYGTKVKPDPVTQENIWFYPLRKHLLKVLASGSILIMMMMLVLASVIGVIAYRVIMTVDFCPSDKSGTDCFLITTMASSVLNAISILLLGKIYDKLAIVLTDWENHRTQTKYDDALIIKLFAFQFVNTYASCFYIAFFRGRFSTFDDKYTDSCEGSCMTQLSFQVMVLMVAKPFPKFFKDIILPLLKKVWVNRPACCCRCKCRCRCCCKKNQVEEQDAETVTDNNIQHSNHKSFLERERSKPDAGDFTLAEYTEKVMLYGFLMLFACSFPLAPLLALVICYIDIKVDAKRMLWLYRRPVAFLSEDIGRWFDILTLVNFIGVLTNAFIIAFTSSWGNKFDTYGKLWVVIGFEHIVFALKFILAYMIPDVPQNVTLAIRREKYLILKKFDEGSKAPSEEDYSSLFPPGGIPKDSIAEEDDDDIDVKPTSVSHRQNSRSFDLSTRKRKAEIESTDKTIIHMTVVNVGQPNKEEFLVVDKINEGGEKNLNRSVRKRTSESPSEPDEEKSKL